MTKKANSLIIVILLISILTSLSLSLAKLMATDTASLASYLGQSKANYLAEGLTEIAMYELKANPEGGFTETTYPEESNNTYLIQNQSDIFPFQQNTPNPEQNFYPLRHNQSTTIKLTKNTTFLVEYFLASPNTKDGQYDSLLWKLFGENDQKEIESLTEFFPVTQFQGSDEVQELNEPLTDRNPATFGSQPGSKGFNCGTFFANNQLTPPKPCQTRIEEFITTHTNLHLTLTNAVNAGARRISEEEAIIYFRICQKDTNAPLVNCNNRPDRPEGKNLTPQEASITAQAQFGSYRAEKNTTLNPKSLLPVFDYALYQTD